MVSHVGTSVVAGTSSTSSPSITLPASIQDNDFGILLVCSSQSAAPPTPSGWTALTSSPFEATGSLYMHGWRRTMVSGDSSSTISWSGQPLTKYGLCAVISRDAIYNANTYGNDGLTNTTEPNPTAAVPTNGYAVSFWAERSSTSSTTITAPSGFTKRGEGFGTGGGGVSICGATNYTSTASPVGGGTWTASNSNGNVGALTVSIVDSAVTHNVNLTESIGLEDEPTQQELNISETLPESVGITDSVSTQLNSGHSVEPTETVGITDNVTVDLQKLYDVLLSESLGVTDTVDASESAIPTEGSLADIANEYLTGLGYTTGTLQDKQYNWLLNLYTASFGAPSTPLSSADMQAALGKQVRDVIRPGEY